MDRFSFVFARLSLALAVVTLFFVPVPASAQNTIEFLGEFTVMGVSNDGTAAAGLSFDGTYEAIRWTPDAGLVRLGMSSGALIGRSGGLAEISADGQRVAASIVTADTLYQTTGRWTKGEGWEQTMPPLPPGGGLLDEKYGSVWGMSGDGETVVGLFWLPGSSGDSAHAFSWTAGGGTVDLGSQGHSSRANGANHDGSVVVGWSAQATGAWQPTVWENGTLTVLEDVEVTCTLESASADGNILAGQNDNPDTGRREASVWLRDGTGWQSQFLGALPGTFPGFGWSQAMDVNWNGSVVVGYNAYTFSSREGFVWTLEQGLMKASDFIEGLGITLPVDFTIQSMTGLSDDGRYLCGYGYYGELIGIRHSFIVHVQNPSPVPDAPSLASVSVGPNYPNPFNPSTTIALTMDKAGPVRLEIYDVRGRLVRVAHDGPLTVGRHEVSWNGRDLEGRQVNSGIYLARASLNDGTTHTHRMMLVK